MLLVVEICVLSRIHIFGAIAIVVAVAIAAGNDGGGEVMNLLGEKEVTSRGIPQANSIFKSHFFPLWANSERVKFCYRFSSLLEISQAHRVQIHTAVHEVY